MDNLDETVYSIELDTEEEEDNNVTFTQHDLLTSTPSAVCQSEGSISDVNFSDDNSEISLEVEDAAPSLAIVLPELSLKNYAGDAETEEDYENDWAWILGSDNDNCFSMPFTGDSGDLNINTEEWAPEAFFQQFFNDSMWDHIADNTNLYVQRKKCLLGQDALQQIQNENFKAHSRLNRWSDVMSNDIKIFTAQLLLMGIIQKPQLESYWSQDSLSKIPLFQ